MVLSPRPPMKKRQSLPLSDADVASSSVVSGSPSQRMAVSRFEEGLMKGLRSGCIAKLRNDVGSLSWPGSPLEWLKEPLAMGFTPEEIVDLLLEDSRCSPWIPYEIPWRAMPQMDPDFHLASCIHRSVHDESRSMKLLTADIKRKIAEYCGLGGIISLARSKRDQFGQVRFEDSTAYISYRNPEDDDSDEPRVAQKALERCRLALDRIIDVCAWLQRTGWLCNQIVVIRYDDGFRTAAIPLTLISQLRECVDEAITRHSLHPDQRNYRMFETALQLLWMEAPASLLPGYQLENAVDLCALAVQMISISLLSICEAHVGALHPFFLDRPITKVCLSGIDGPLCRDPRAGFHLGGLACLGLMIGEPIMVFASGWPSTIQEDTRDTLETSIEHLHELWGPERLILGRERRSPGQALSVKAIKIGAGFIYEPSEESKSGADLHWAPGDWELELPTDHGLVRHFDISGTLNIGGLFSINHSCPLRLDHYFVPSSVIRQEIHVLGTQKASWSLQQIQAGFQVGQIANATLNATWMKSGSRTRKEQAVAEISLNVLNQSCGLLVSLCTGVAHRVPLREVIAEVFPHMIPVWLEDPDMDQTLSNYDVREKMRHPDYTQWLSGQSLHDRKTFSRRINYVLRKLCWTGVSSKSKLVTACPSDEQADGCIHISLDDCPILATILQDTEKSATFSSLTTECFVSEQHKCQFTSQPEWKNKVTALSTSVCQYRYTGGGDWEKVPNQGLEHGRLYWMGHMKENRRLVAEVSSDQEDDIVLKVAGSQVPWSFYLRAYEKVERMRARYIALREQSYAGEEGAQEVLVVSD